MQGVGSNGRSGLFDWFRAVLGSDCKTVAHIHVLAFLQPRKNRLQKCILCPPAIFPFRSHRPIKELGENGNPPDAIAIEAK
ncbi:hypothetical protein CEXT_98591 [Caerostris extrusa]|uniref:Uncharacterized protein n=1 Tax=Caerostris extrusa TaxID=172846 RepID=A0AAV4XGS8_CAEEX|nr:hypothetical protein CEXT_98591 [Caerostris extrusa]